MVTESTKRGPWYTCHVGCSGRYADSYRYVESAEEARADSEARNAKEREANGGTLDAGHFFVTNAACSTLRCRGIALTPNGFCAECQADEDAGGAE